MVLEKHTMCIVGEDYQLVPREDPSFEFSRGPLMGGRFGLSLLMSTPRRVVPIIIISSLLVCCILYYTSPMSATAVFAPSATSERNGLPSAKTEAYPKRLRFRGTQRRLPQALIIGVRKCGTRALLEMLNLHPRVRKNGNEMHFFDVDERYANGIEWYRKKMPYSFDNQVTVEKTPSYFVSREAPARVRAMNESTRLLLIVREPAIRVLSDYTQIMDSKLKKGVKVAPFHEKVLTPEGEVNDGYKAIKISQYAVHLLHWLREFPLDQIHIIDGDNLIVDPFTEIDKVQRFLRLPPHITAENFYFNETKGFYCMRNETFQKCLAESKGRPHPQVDPVVMSRLRKFFAPFNEQFYEMVGRNFSWPTS
ncbi:heparan sulfate glucosamine 3-O-sulfotransferase 1-like isoform X2 [Macrobrachium rosenbergii]|uniref:heparan sulfate glucosamine 3-O-sulfotransferase 1-like isoform X2 n=1 Tax=Macrobrachium rosenbergii TaxID=79674 RepID=UPI0034D3D109